MDWDNPRSVETRITRLTHELEEIDNFFYGISRNEDRDLYAGMLERKRDDIVRACVLQLHTAIEDLLSSMIFCRMLNVSSGKRWSKTQNKSAQALNNILIGSESIGFHKMLYLAVSLRILNENSQKRLSELNRLRNKCSHNWLLNVTIRRGKKPVKKGDATLLGISSGDCS